MLYLRISWATPVRAFLMRKPASPSTIPLLKWWPGTITNGVTPINSSTWFRNWQRFRTWSLAQVAGYWLQVTGYWLLVTARVGTGDWATRQLLIAYCYFLTAYFHWLEA